MSHRYHDLMFTPSIRACQTERHSRGHYARLEAAPDHNAELGPNEAAFIAARDSFYMATVSETGWPYLQHRGGPAGFLRVLDGQTIGFADFVGNRQYISVGNIAGNDRVALFLMDYPNRARLKLVGRLRVVSAGQDPDLTARLAMPDHPARIDHAVLIDVAAFDWNCSQHITPRFSADDVAPAIADFQTRIARLEDAVRQAGGIVPA